MVAQRRVQLAGSREGEDEGEGEGQGQGERARRHGVGGTVCWLGCPRADVVPYVVAHLLTYLPTYLLCLHKLCGRPQCMTRAVCRRNGRNCAPALNPTPIPTPTPPNRNPNALR